MVPTEHAVEMVAMVAMAVGDHQVAVVAMAVVEAEVATADTLSQPCMVRPHFNVMSETA